MEAKSKKAKLGTTIGFFVAFGVTTLVIKTFSKDKYEKLVEVADKTNEQCPMMIDADTRIDSTTAVKEPLGVVYYYTVVTVDKDSIDIAQTHQFLKENSQQNLDTMKGMKPFRDENVSLRYHYRDRNGNPFIDFTILPTK